MKSFVRDSSTAVRGKVGAFSPSGSAGGRFRSLPDLWDIVLPVVGAVILAEILGVIETGRLVQLMLAGITFGAVTGRSIIVWREWGGSELPPGRMRQIEGAWVLVGAVVSMLLFLLP